MQSSSKILVVGGSPEEIGRLEEWLPDWECVAVSVDADGTIPARPRLALVYAQPKEEDTLSICRQLREVPASAEAPILLVMGRYQISQGSAVRSMGNDEFIAAPLSEERLRAKIDELTGGP